MAAIAMKDLLEAGVHFGHQTKRWNPKMKEYIFGERNGIYILDLGKTVKLFHEAESFVSKLAGEGRTLLFVGTKRQAQDVIAEHGFRPATPEAATRHAGRFGRVSLFGVDGVVPGGWPAAQAAFFDDGGAFDRLYAVAR